MQTPSVVLNIGADVAKDEIVVACSEGSFPVEGLSMISGVAKAGKLQILLASLGHRLPFSAHISTLYIPLLVGTLSLVVLACKWRISATVTTETRN